MKALAGADDFVANASLHLDRCLWSGRQSGTLRTGRVNRRNLEFSGNDPRVCTERSPPLSKELLGRKSSLAGEFVLTNCNRSIRPHRSRLGRLKRRAMEIRGKNLGDRLRLSGGSQEAGAPFP